MKQPDHLAGPAFKEARDKIAFLAAQLSEAEKAQYAAFLSKQEKDKDEQKRKAARLKAEYDQAKEKRPGAVRNYDPPVKIKDPYLRKMAMDAEAEHYKVASLAITQLENRLRFLEKLEQGRNAQIKKAEQRQEKLAQDRDDTQRKTRGRASPEFSRAVAAKERPQARDQFARAATDSKGKTESRTTAKLDPAKEEAVARAIARVKEKEKAEEKERGRDDRSEARERSS
jgi:hypothetical protein